MPRYNSALIRTIIPYTVYSYVITVLFILDLSILTNVILANLFIILPLIQFVHRDIST